MGWSVYEDVKGRKLRWAGYGVPAYCDHPGCNEEIDRGLSYVCGMVNQNEDDGCGLHFCGKHLRSDNLCERCVKGKEPFEPKPDHPKWVQYVLADESWKKWRDVHPEYAEKYKTKSKGNKQ